jgi:putative MATE family efflux protein
MDYERQNNMDDCKDKKNDRENCESDNSIMASSEVTKGVSLLIGDPKKAVLKLSGPMIVAMMIMAGYNLVNAVWVSGLGSDELAAVGFVTPVFMILVGLGNGIGAGVSSAISRRIGARDKSGADKVAMHALLIALFLSLVLTFPLYYFLEPILRLLGAGSTIGLAMDYGQIVFAGTILLIFEMIAYSILQAEGDTKRTMYVMSASSIINAILDPILIYYAGMGIAGAAWGTVISIALAAIVLFYWLLIKKDTYVDLQLKAFSFDWAVLKDILNVGFPASLEFLLFSIDCIILNEILVHVSGTDAVAVYTGGLRVVMMAIIPMAAIGTATISVAAAAFGARNYRNIRIIHEYSIRLGLIIGIAISALTWLLAPQIAVIFTYTPQSAHLAPTFVAFLQTMCLFYPFVSPGIMSASVFQGVGNGFMSLVLELLRVLVFIAVLAFTFAVVLDWGQEGVWWGIVLGNILGGTAGYLCARLYIARLEPTESQWHSVGEIESKLT